MGSSLLGMEMQRQRRQLSISAGCQGEELELYAEGNYIFQKGESFKMVFLEYISCDPRYEFSCCLLVVGG